MPPQGWGLLLSTRRLIGLTHRPQHQPLQGLVGAGPSPGQSWFMPAPLLQASRRLDWTSDPTPAEWEWHSHIQWDASQGAEGLSGVGASPVWKHENTFSLYIGAVRSWANSVPRCLGLLICEKGMGLAQWRTYSGVPPPTPTSLTKDSSLVLWAWPLREGAHLAP